MRPSAKKVEEVQADKDKIPLTVTVKAFCFESPQNYHNIVVIKTPVASHGESEAHLYGSPFPLPAFVVLKSTG
jgi:hypothetical protein